MLNDLTLPFTTIYLIEIKAPVLKNICVEMVYCNIIDGKKKSNNLETTQMIFKRRLEKLWYNQTEMFLSNY